jgi:hypothetical protein
VRLGYLPISCIFAVTKFTTCFDQFAVQILEIEADSQERDYAGVFVQAQCQDSTILDSVCPLARRHEAIACLFATLFWAQSEDYQNAIR